MKVNKEFVYRMGGSGVEYDIVVQMGEPTHNVFYKRTDGGKIDLKSNVFKTASELDDILSGYIAYINKVIGEAKVKESIEEKNIEGVLMLRGFKKCDMEQDVASGEGKEGRQEAAKNNVSYTIGIW